jgi:hypothetical protein
MPALVAIIQILTPGIIYLLPEKGKVYDIHYGIDIMKF